MHERRLGVFPQRKTEMSNNQDQIDQRFFVMRPAGYTKGFDEFSEAQAAAEKLAAEQTAAKC